MIAHTVESIKGAGKQYKTFQLAELRLNNQVKAIERMLAGGQDARDDHKVPAAGYVLEDEGGLVGPDTPTATAALVAPKLRKVSAEMLAEMGAAPLLAAKDHIAAHRRAAGRAIEAKVIDLPVWSEFCADVRGVGKLALGLIVSETGDLSAYANPAKVWKRMGLAVGNDGRAQRRIRAQADFSKGKTKDDARDEAIAAGYSPRRRSLMHVVGECLIKLNGDDGPYKSVYNERKTYEQAKAPDLAPIVHHKRAMRYMEKRFLRDLWKAWRRSAKSAEAPQEQLPVGASEAA